MEKLPLTSTPVIDICLAMLRFALLSDALLMIFVILSDDTAKHHEVEILEANLYVRKMTLNDDFMSTIEKPLLSSPASYPYFETIQKRFWLQLDFIVGSKKIFSRGNQSAELQIV